MPESVISDAERALVSRAAQPLEDMRALRTLARRYGREATLGQALEQAAGIVANATEEYRTMKMRGEAL